MSHKEKETTTYVAVQSDSNISFSLSGLTEHDFIRNFLCCESSAVCHLICNYSFGTQILFDFKLSNKRNKNQKEELSGTVRQEDYQPMAWGVDEVEAAVHSVVDDVSSVQPTLILQIPLKLVIYVANHWLEAEKTVTTLSLVHMHCRYLSNRSNWKDSHNTESGAHALQIFSNWSSV